MSAALCTGLHCAAIPHKPACRPCGRSSSILCLPRSPACPASGRSWKSFTRACSTARRPRVVDLLFHLPSGVIDRRARPKLRDVQAGQVVTVAVTIGKHRPGPPRRSRAPYRVYASDDTGDITLTYFNPQPRLSGKTAAGRRNPLRLRHGRILRRHAADGASRPCRG